MRTIAPDVLLDLLRGDDELALLDVREERPFGREHILYASVAPRGRLELRAPLLVPRRGTPVVVCDAGEGLAEGAAARLEALGYGDVRVLDGGLSAWKAAGLETFSGVNVPSKAFGELVETRYATPALDADALKTLLDRGEDVVILDSRPFVEYHARSIPGGICCPGAELAYRVHDAAPEPGTTVVVNCAGRTRSIIGAQSLVNAGVPNRVYALRNGTMGWHLAGHALEIGMARRAPAVSARGLDAARAAAARVAERFGVERIDHATLGRWRAEARQRTLFVFDVRSPEEYVAGHLPDTRSAPGGQLVQETDQFAGTLRARIVLVDDTGVRATMTASWLRQMGWEAYVLDDALAGRVLEAGPEPVRALGLDAARAELVSPRELEALLAAGDTTVVDLGSSRAYVDGHVPGAWFAIRARLRASIARIPLAARVALTSENGVLAHLAAAEVADLAGRPAVALAGGTAAWRATGLALEPGPSRMADDRDDVYERPYERDWGDEQAMSDYLTWEVALVPKLERDGTARFARAPVAS